MHRLQSFVAAAMLSIAVAACGSSADEPGVSRRGDPAGRTTSSTAAPTTTTTEPPAPVLEGSQLQAAMLTVADLPAGWGAPPEDMDEDGTDDDTLCDQATKAFPDTAPDHEVSFSTGGYIPLLVQAATSLPEDQNNEAFAKSRVAFAGCVGKSWDQVDGDTTTHFTASDVSFPKLGDESFAYRLNGTFELEPSPSISCSSVGLPSQP
jgi:hypothetical protein